MGGPGNPENAKQPRSDPGKLSKWDFLIAALIFAVVLGQGWHTIHEVGISWDEPLFFREARDYAEWFNALGRSGSFSRETLEQTFGFRAQADYHPALGKLIPSFFILARSSVPDEFFAFRMSAVMLFGLLLVTVYFRAAKYWGRPAGLAAALCTAFLPRLFVHGHISATEIPLCFFWFLAAWVFEESTRRRNLIPLAGICYGLVMSVKFTGLLLPAPLLLWALIYRRKNLVPLMASLALLGPIVFILLQPAMWHHPFSAFLEYISRNLSLKNWNPVAILFLKVTYQSSPPWYYAPFMVMVTAPAATLMLFLVGVGRAAADRFKDRLSGSCLIHFLFFMALTMLPNAPVYDGERQFIPAFVFLAMLAGSGFDLVVRSLMRLGRTKKLTSVLVGTAATVLLGVAVCRPLTKIYPYGLEYYNELIGGVKGARERGMETSYWWTAFNFEGLDSVNKILPQGASLGFYPMTSDLWELYGEMGLLRKDISVKDGKESQYVLILSRPYQDLANSFVFAGAAPIHPRLVRAFQLHGVTLWALYLVR
jgi:hypothetical protein